MNGINWKRVLLGALTGGVAWLILGTVRGIALAVLFGSTGPQFSTPPGPDYSLLALVSCPAFALLAAWLYASIRPRYGPGPATALRAGLVLGLTIWMIDILWATAASASLEYRIASVLTGLMLTVPATLVAAWTYKEAAGAEGSAA